MLNLFGNRIVGYLMLRLNFIIISSSVLLSIQLHPFHRKTDSSITNLKIKRNMESIGIPLLGFIFCVNMSTCMCKANTSELGRLKVKVNKLTRDQDALQSDVDKIWETIITSGINTWEHDNRTRTDDAGIKIQEFITKVNGKLTALEGQRREIDNMVISVRNGLKQEKVWQHEAISNVTEYYHDIQSGLTTETRDLKQTVQDMQENNAENEQKLSNIETEIRELRSMIVELQLDKKKMQDDIANIEAENKAMKDVIRRLENDNENVKTELALLERQLLKTTTTTTKLPTPTTTTMPPTRTDDCDDGWQRFNGHCYMFVEQYKTWDDALSYCETRRGYLLEITSDIEYEFVRTELIRLKWIYFWTGGTDRRSHGTFLYHHSGEPVPNKYWAPGQPDNVVGNEHCVKIYYLSSEYLGLGDISCYYNYWFICEKS